LKVWICLVSGVGKEVEVMEKVDCILCPSPYPCVVVKVNEPFEMVCLDNHPCP
jgi:hypothetical protein